MSKGGEVGEVEEVTGADQTHDLTLDLCVWLVVCSGAVSVLLTGRWRKKAIGRTVPGSDCC